MRIIIGDVHQFFGYCLVPLDPLYLVMPNQYVARILGLNVIKSVVFIIHNFRSLDAFRGLSISVMIFVNYGGGNYYFFNHSPWNGKFYWVAATLIFTVAETLGKM